MLKQGLQQKLLQKLSPQQIQLIKLLQIPTDALEERIKEELEGNPALEEGLAEDAEEEEIPTVSEDTDVPAEATTEEPERENGEEQIPESEDQVAEVKEEKEEIQDLESDKEDNFSDDANDL